MIKAVMFDMGGTLEDLYSDEKNDKATAYALYEILKKHEIKVPYEAEELWKIVGAGIQAYKKDSERTLRELKPEEIWVDWGFKDIPVALDVRRSARRSRTCGRRRSTIANSGNTARIC